MAHSCRVANRASSVPASADRHSGTDVEASSGRIETFDVVQLAEVAKPADAQAHGDGSLRARQHHLEYLVELSNA